MTLRRRNNSYDFAFNLYGILLQYSNLIILVKIFAFIGNTFYFVVISNCLMILSCKKMLKLVYQLSRVTQCIDFI